MSYKDSETMDAGRWHDGCDMAEYLHCTKTWQSISIALRQCHSLSASSLAHQIKLMTLKMCEVCLVFF